MSVSQDAPATGGPALSSIRVMVRPSRCLHFLLGRPRAFATGTEPVRFRQTVRYGRRYGQGGDFWADHTKLASLPISHWEIWNEENIVTQAKEPDPAEYAKLIRISGRTLRARIWRGLVDTQASGRTLAEHEAIFNALSIRDAALSQAAALLHVSTTEQSLREHLRSGEAPPLR